MAKIMTGKNLMLLIIGLLLIVTVVIVVLVRPEIHAEEITLDPNYVDFITKEQFESKGHMSILREYDTNASVAYLNKDGTKTLYVFSSPIRYYNKSGGLSNIDTRIKNVSEESFRNQGYLYTIANSDIAPYYPADIKQGVLIEGNDSYRICVNNKKSKLAQYTEKQNFIGQKKHMISYNNAFGRNTCLSFYPSSSGTHAEILFYKKPTFNVLKMVITVDEYDVKVGDSGYITINKHVTDKTGIITQEIAGVIQLPLLKDEGGKLSYQSRLSAERICDGKYQLIFTLDKSFFSDAGIQYPVKCYTSFELRRENQPDSAVYSNKPEVNSYLSNYTILGNSKNYGLGQIRIRYHFAQFFQIKSDDIISATYHLYNLSEKNTKDNLELITLLEDWCSLTGTWSQPIKQGKQISSLTMDSEKLTFNIAEEVKKWCDDTDGQQEHNGLLLKSINEQDGVWNIISTNDCTLFNNFTEVILK